MIRFETRNQCCFTGFCTAGRAKATQASTEPSACNSICATVSVLKCFCVRREGGGGGGGALLRTQSARGPIFKTQLIRSIVDTITMSSKTSAAAAVPKAASSKGPAKVLSWQSTLYRQRE
jgi:hypothetical protein